MAKSKMAKFKQGREGLLDKIWRKSVFGQLFRLTFFGQDKTQ